MPNTMRCGLLAMATLTLVACASAPPPAPEPPAESDGPVEIVESGPAGPRKSMAEFLQELISSGKLANELKAPIGRINMPHVVSSKNWTHGHLEGHLREQLEAVLREKVTTKPPSGVESEGPSTKAHASSP